MPTLPSFDGTKLWYEDHVEGPGAADAPAVLLLHGFAADTNLNFVRPGLLDRFLDDGYRVVVTDYRGHGLSEKPHDASAYADGAIRRDVQGLLDHLGVGPVAVIGYSMGAAIALQLAAHDPRVTRVVAIGVGASWVDDSVDPEKVIAALLADDVDGVTDRYGRRFRLLIDAAGGDRFALAACMSARVPVVEYFDRVNVPLLLVAGTDDDVAGDPQCIVEQLRGARLVQVPGNHFDLNAQVAVHDAAAAFLAEDGAPSD